MDIASDLVNYIDPLSPEYSNLFKQKSNAKTFNSGYFYQSSEVQFQNNVLIKYVSSSPIFIIPNFIDTIGDEAFKDNNHITKIIIPSHVKQIGKFAFSNCKSLKSIKIPDRVNVIQKGTFQGCTSLVKIAAKNIETISDYAFYETGIEAQAFFQPSLKNIGSYAFGKTNTKGKIILGQSLQQLGDFIFDQCFQINEVVLLSPNIQLSRFSNLFDKPEEFNTKYNVTTIELGGSRYPDGFLSNLQKIMNISLPNLKDLSEALFENNTALTNVTFNNKIEVIPDRLFKNCIRLSKIFVNDLVLKRIGISAFENCQNLKTIPVISVETIQDRAFFGSSITNIDAFIRSAKFLGDECIGGIQFSSLTLPFVGAKEKEPDTIKNKFGYIFSKTEFIQSTEFMQHLNINKTIGQKRFIPKTLKTVSFEIGNFTGYSCSNVPEITLFRFPETTLTLPEYTFYQCLDLLEFSIPKDCEVFDAKVIDLCPKLTKIYSHPSAKNFKTIDGVLFDKLISNLIFIPINYPEKTYQLPPSVKVIKSRAISRATFIEEVILNTTLESFETEAIYRCEKLKRIKLPQTVKNIEENAISFCPLLTAVSLYPTTSFHQSGVFIGCNQLKSLHVHFTDASNLDFKFYRIFSKTKSDLTYEFNGHHIPSALTKIIVHQGIIGAYAFEAMKSIQNIDIKSKVKAIEAFAFKDLLLQDLIVPDSVKNINEKAFFDLRVKVLSLPFLGSDNQHPFLLSKIINTPELTTITIKSGVLIDGACSSNGHLEHIEIQGVTTIGQQVFQGCTNIKKFVIPKSVTKIARGAFEGSSIETLMVEDQHPIYQVVDQALVEQKTLIYYSPNKKDTVYNVPLSIEVIAEGSIQNNQHLKKLVIAEHVKQVEAQAIMDCEKLESIELLTNKISPIASYFKGTLPKINAVKVSSKVIPHSAFSGLAYLQKLEIASTTEIIGDFAFADCARLASVAMPETLKGIGDFAFKNCGAMTTMVIPDSVEKIGLGVFSGCSRLSTLTLPMRPKYEASALSKYGGTFGSLFGTFEYAHSQAVEQRINDTTKRIYYFPNGLTAVRVTQGTIAEGTFSGLSFLKELVVENIEGDIGAYAFESCVALKAIVLKTGTKTIGKEAFKDCRELLHFESGDDLSVIESRAFQGCQKLKQVQIGKALTLIETTIFDGCDQLSDIQIAQDNSKYRVVDGCLMDEVNKTVMLNPCKNPNEIIHMPDTMEIIASRAFYQSEKLREVKFSKKLKTIESEAFYGCSNLQDVDLQGCNQLTKIGQEAFADCTSLKVFTGPITASILNFGIFKNTNQLQRISTAYNGQSPFTFHQLFTANKSSQHYEVKGKYIPKALKSIRYNGFFLTDSFLEGFQSVTDIELDNNLTTIGQQVFQGCTNIKKFVIPKSVTKIARGAFEGSSIETLMVEDQHPIYQVVDQALVEQKTLIYYSPNKKDTVYNVPLSIEVIAEGSIQNNQHLKKLVIAEHVKQVEAQAIMDCEKLESIELLTNKISPIASYFKGTLPKINAVKVSSKVIPHSAFSGLAYLQKLEIASTTEIIGDFAFADCARLASVAMPETLKGIGDFAFKNCGAMTTMVIPDSVEKIGLGVFSGCSRLSTLTLPMRPKYEASALSKYGGTFGSLFGTFEYAHSQAVEQRINDTTKRIYYFPNGLTAVRVTQGTIAEGTFSGLSFLKELVVENIEGDIGAYAFESCVALKAIVLKTGTKTIGKEAFKDCRELLHFESGDDLSVIESRAFQGCQKLKQVQIGKALTLIETTIFDGCDQLSDIQIAQDNSKYRVVDGCLMDEVNKTVMLNPCKNPNEIIHMPDTMEIIASRAFYQSEKLREVKFSKKLKTIESEAFYGCSNLQDVDLQGCNQLTKIGQEAFADCTSLNAVTLNNQLQVIEDRSFYQCKKLEFLNFPHSIVSLGQAILQGCYAISTIRIPFLGSDRNSQQAKLNYLFFNLSQSAPAIKDIHLYQSFIGIEIFEGNVGKEAFKNFKSLKSVMLPASTKEIFSSTFENCLNLEGVVNLKEVKKIHDRAFYQCQNLKLSFNQLPVLESIGVSAFEDCQKLTELNLPLTLTTLATASFKHCVNVIKIIVPEAVTLIPSETFAQQEQLKSVSLPSSVIQINAKAFEGCEKLQSIVISKHIKYIQKYAFLGCRRLVIEVEKMQNINFFPRGWNSFRYLADDISGFFGRLIAKIGSSTLKVIEKKEAKINESK